MAHQRADGSWPGLREDRPDAGHPTSIAASALACMALLEYRDAAPDAVRPVLARGIDGVLARAKVVNPASHWSYIWSQVYPLRLLARLTAHPGFKEESPRWRAAAEGILAAVYQAQRPEGGWGYSQAGTSFQTADVLLALREIQDAGVPVWRPAVEKGVALLAGMRTDQGFAYGPGDQLVGHMKSFHGKMALVRSAGRNCVCDLALRQYGNGPADRLEGTVQAFMDHRRFLWDVWGYDGKTPRDGADLFTEAGSPYAHFVYYAHHHAAFAMRGAASEKRDAWRAELRKDLLAARVPDGTWLQVSAGYPRDKEHGIGNASLATAMALLALAELDRAAPSGPDAAPDSLSWRAEPPAIVRKGYLGVQLAGNVPEGEAGALVESVVEGGPAAAGGIRGQDVIVSLDGVSVAGADDLVARIAACRPGAGIRFGIVREGRRLEVTVVLGER